MLGAKEEVVEEKEPTVRERSDSKVRRRRPTKFSSASSLLLDDEEEGGQQEEPAGRERLDSKVRRRRPTKFSPASDELIQLTGADGVGESKRAEGEEAEMLRAAAADKDNEIAELRQAAAAMSEAMAVLKQERARLEEQAKADAQIIATAAAAAAVVAAAPMPSMLLSPTPLEANSDVAQRYLNSVVEETEEEDGSSILTKKAKSKRRKSKRRSSASQGRLLQITYQYDKVGSKETYDAAWEKVMAQDEGGAQAKGGNIVVAIRVRPINSREKKMKANVAIHTSIVLKGKAGSGSGQHSVEIVQDTGGGHEDKKNLGFDWVFDSQCAPETDHCATQAAVFDQLGTSVLRSAFNGYNVSLLAYGQTGSGKSHSLLGTAGEPGLVPRICEYLWYFVEHKQTETTAKVEASYLEIYNEKVRDLLNPTQSGTNLRIRETPRTGGKMQSNFVSRFKRLAGCRCF
jgi:hypothetical protein